MISGFNTDIEFNGTVYHVQTEDKGLPSRQIMSLVYNRGTILASKRVTYDDLMIGQLDERELADRVGRQHKLMCAAIKAGRINELREMTAKAAHSAGGRKREPAPAVVAEQTPIAMPAMEETPVPEPLVHVSLPRRNSKVTIIEAAPAVTIEMPSADLEPVIEVVSIIEDELILPAEAVAVVSELSGRERPANNKLSLELLGENKFKGGDRRTVNIMVCRGTGRKVVKDAQIMIKVLGSSFRPVIFHARSDENGLARVHLQLPHFHAGRAAILIRVTADGEESELRRIVTPG